MFTLGPSPTPPHHVNSTTLNPTTTSATVASTSSATHPSIVSTSYTSSVSMSPSPSPVPPSCGGMEEIRKELDQNPVYLLNNCSLDSSCAHIHCLTLDGSTLLALEACPPGFTISITSPAGSQSQTFTKSGHMDIKGTHDVLLVYLTNWDNKVLGLSINSSESGQGELENKVIPRTNVSIDTSHCSSKYGMHDYEECIHSSLRHFYLFSFCLRSITWQW